MRGFAYLFLAIGFVMGARADTLTLVNGQVVKGCFMGFADRKFEFKAASGAVISEYPVNVKSIIPDAPLPASVELANKVYEDVEFRSFGEYLIHLTREEQVMDERVIMLKKMKVNRPPEPVAPPPAETENETIPAGSREGAATPQGNVREWQRTGKWREVESKNSMVISKGEEVEIENHLKKGYINIVHFHYPKALTSIREGNYVEALAANRTSRIKILKIVIPDFNAPVCEALELKSLPQFWFYDTKGILVQKLTDRFTEGDIDAALKKTRRGLD